VSIKVINKKRRSGGEGGGGDSRAGTTKAAVLNRQMPGSLSVSVTWSLTKNKNPSPVRHYLSSSPFPTPFIVVVWLRALLFRNEPPFTIYRATTYNELFWDSNCMGWGWVRSWDWDWDLVRSLVLALKRNLPTNPSHIPYHVSCSCIREEVTEMV
jgi:hypothetical protein